MMMADIYWLAGLLEGEGFFGVINSRVSGRLYRYPRVGVSMSDKDVIEKAAKMFGTSLGIARKMTAGGKTMYRSVCVGTRAVCWMMTLYSLLGIRRRGQIRKSLCEWREIANANERRRLESRRYSDGQIRDGIGRFVVN